MLSQCSTSEPHLQFSMLKCEPVQWHLLLEWPWKTPGKAMHLQNDVEPVLDQVGGELVTLHFLTP